MSGTPNQTCTCGFTRFLEKRASSTSSSTLWMPYFGTNGDTGSPADVALTGDTETGGTWAQVPYTRYAATAALYCENCGRLRSQREIGAMGVVGTRFTPRGVYVLGDGVLTDLSARFDGFGQTFLVNASAVDPAALELPAWSLSPPTSTAESPSLPIVEQILFFRYPDVMESGEYTVNLIGSLLTVPLGIVVLEAIPVFSVNDAIVFPSPHRAWCQQDSRLESPVGQPGGEPLASIPFDKCYGVIEFDSADGLPSAQGWTLAGTASSGTWALLPEYVQYSNGSAETSYWEQTLALGSAPSAVYVQAAYQCISNAGGLRSIDVLGEGAESSVNYFGARFSADDLRSYAKTLDGTYEQPLGNADPAEWTLVAGASSLNAAAEAIWLKSSSTFAASTFFGTGTAAPATQLVAQFGTTTANACSVLWRSVIVSTPGRFVRAQYRGVSSVQDPVLHMYMRRDEGVASVPTARFKIKYGTLLGTPTSTEVSAVLTNANELVDVSVTLTGIEPGAIWWSVERVWDSGLDAIEQTVHLLHSTLKAV